MTSMHLGNDVTEFLKVNANEDEYKVLNNGKIQCVLTNHELKASIECVRAHWFGRRVRVARIIDTNIDETQCADELHIVPHRFEKKKMYCLVTKKTLNRNMHEITAHVVGRRYLANIEAYEKKKNRGDKSDDENIEQVDDEGESDNSFEVVSADNSDTDTTPMPLTMNIDEDSDDDGDECSINCSENIPSSVDMNGKKHPNTKLRHKRSNNKKRVSNATRKVESNKNISKRHRSDTNQ